MKKEEPEMRRLQWMMKTEVGNLYLVASPNGLQGVFLEQQEVASAHSLRSSQPENLILAQAVSELKEYFQGRRDRFGVPFDIQGTPFQKKVWNALTKIPYGKTCSYGDLARKIKNAKAVRAVGSANGKNPLCIIVPCHRVIAASGSLGGYSGGLAMKDRLLTLERRSVARF